MRTLGLYLLYAAVALRGLVRFWDGPEPWVLLAALITYGLLLALSLHMPEAPDDRERPRGRDRSTLLMSVYLIIQAACVMALFTLHTGADFFALLFVPLSLQAALFFGGRIGSLWIAFFCVCMLVGLRAVEPEALFGPVMTIVYGGLCFLFGGYASQVHRAEAARRENQRLIADLRTAHVGLERYSHQLEDLAAEHERARLARDLHDSVTQTAFSMNLAVQSARLLVGREAGLLAGQLERLEQLAADAMREIQALVSELSGGAAVPHDLAAALGRLAAERERRDGLNVILDVRGHQPLPEQAVLNLVAIAQEALTNVAKHSGVCAATLRLELEPECMALEIEDHGSGFRTGAQAQGRGHLGLAGMRERAREIGWSLSVASQPGAGTCVRVWKDGVESPAGAQ